MIFEMGSALAELGELRLDLVEVREILRVIFHLRVLHRAFTIEEERGTLGDTAHYKIGLGEELLIRDPVSLSHLVLIV